MQNSLNLIPAPRSPKSDVVDDFHGTLVPDPYRWLEQADNPDAKRWTKAHNERTRNFLDQLPNLEKIKNRLTSLWNYPKLEDLRKLAKDYGADLRVSRFRPSGRGTTSLSYLGPEKDQLEDFAIWLEQHDLVRTGDSFFCLTSENRRRKGLDMCGAAKMTCCIGPNGNVYPCAFLQEQCFNAGNVRTASFKDIWDHAPVFFQLRNLNVESCQTCQRFDVCRGGCPAVAFHTYHDIAMPDPECLVNLKSAA